MAGTKPHPLAPITPAAARLTFEQLMDARRPLLFSRMPLMVRGDREMGGSFADIYTYPAPMSAHRWNVALQKSRRLRVQRRMAGRAR
jgi:hypothetical protein